MKSDVIRIKKNGKLIAFSGTWQYWLLGDILYYISVDGNSCGVWCGLSSLNAHLRKLYGLLGKKYFTEDEDAVIIDKEFLSHYCYA